MSRAVLWWLCVWIHWVAWNWKLLLVGLSLRHRAQHSAPKMQGNYQDIWPWGPSSVPDFIWARESDGITSVPASPRSHVVGFSVDVLSVTILDSVPRHEEQRFYYLHTQIYAHLRATDSVDMWICVDNVDHGNKIFPQPSIHWMFHWFSCVDLESPLLSAGHRSPAPYTQTSAQVPLICNSWNNGRHFPWQVVK